jgi:hypothetical protein
MRVLARGGAIEILGEENCVKVFGDLYLCGLDYLLIKRFVIAGIADDVFGFVGDGVPVLGMRCERYLMYYGIPRVIYSARYVVEGWRVAAADDEVVVYNCIDDIMDFLEIEMFVFSKVPLGSFGFGSHELYTVLTALLRGKGLYMARYFY